MACASAYGSTGATVARAAARGLLLAACLCLGACASRGGHYYQDDGPPDHAPAGLAQTPDAVPRIEPLNPRANRPYAALGRSYTPDTGDAPFDQRGMASWYGRQYHGNPTASGEPYDMYAMTAAHPTLPIPSYARVTRVNDGRSVIVRINDRGPFVQDRVIDLSFAAATRLGIVGPGSGEVTVHKITARDIAAGSTGAAPTAAGAGTGKAPLPAAPTLATEAAISTRLVAAAPSPGTAAAMAAPPVPVPAATAPVAPAPGPTEPSEGASAAPSTAPSTAPSPAQLAGPAATPGTTPPAVAAAAVTASDPALTTAVTPVTAPPSPPPALQVPDGPPAAPVLAAPDAARDTGAPVSAGGRWAVQLGAFAVQANAEALRDQMSALLAKPEADGLPAPDRQPRIEFDGRLHHVLVGGYEARAAAQGAARALGRYLARDTSVVRR